MVLLILLGSMLCFIPEISTEGELDSLIDCVAAIYTVHAALRSISPPPIRCLNKLGRAKTNSLLFCKLAHSLLFEPSYVLTFHSMWKNIPSAPLLLKSRPLLAPSYLTKPTDLIPSLRRCFQWLILVRASPQLQLQHRSSHPSPFSLTYLPFSGMSSMEIWLRRPWSSG